MTNSEETVLGVSAWLFALDVTVALECLKKPSKSESRKLSPFRSERLLHQIKEKGGLRACLKYLEYLTIELKVEDRAIHTELACLYVQYINSQLAQYYTETDGAKVLDFAKADSDKTVFGNCSFRHINNIFRDP